ncbi:MAG: phosphate transport system regulatory protein PhoU [Spartobacteria bacterium AMD-G4]|nr:MAG: phosphate transport system regulatory protein PhoU [Spartobacteria bacterium AMD-G4]
MQNARHILTNFEDALDNLRKNVLMMSSLSSRSLENARKGLFERDEDWCNTVIADDEEIDALEIQVDGEGMEIMLRFHPFASDLRNVIAAMKTSVNLERASDQSVGIARRARKLIALPLMPVTSRIEPIFNLASSVYNDAIKSYADNDIELARTIKGRDKDLDELNREFADNITEMMPQNPEHIRGFLELIFIARCLERIGDQAKTIAEDIIYAVSVKDIRHSHAAR